MKATIVMNELILSSEFTEEEILNVNNFFPDALAIFNESTKEEEFRIGVVTSMGQGGSIGKYGIFFNERTTDGKAAIKVPVVGETLEQKKDYATFKYGMTMSNLRKVEQNMVSALEYVNDELNTIKSSITSVL
ncbi:hypothetical protein AALA22_15375 [Anaerovoracaceae bacterium 41-7]